MLRTNPASSMQKTYDEVYLVCSTAIYFEQRNNEEEALRSWRAALDQIYYHNAYKIPPNYRPKTETEKALQDSLRDMELQCKERVDLFEALRSSRHETQLGNQNSTSQAATGAPKTAPATNGRASANGWASQRTGNQQSNMAGSYNSQSSLGDGTVLASEYASLARPRPAVPMRPPPTIPRSPGPMASNPIDGNMYNQSVSLQPPSKPTTSRSPSPDKRGSMFRSTLRTDKREGKAIKLPNTVRPKAAKPAAAAATLAWPTKTESLAPTGNNSFNGLTKVSSDSGTSLSSSARASPEPRRPSTLATSQNGPRADLLHRPKSFDSPPSRNSAPVSRQALPMRQVKSYATPAQPLPPNEPPRLPNVEEAMRPPQPPPFPTYRKEYLNKPIPEARKVQANLRVERRQPEVADVDRSSPAPRQPIQRKSVARPAKPTSQQSNLETQPPAQQESELIELEGDSPPSKSDTTAAAFDARVAYLVKNLPKGVDEQAAKSIFNEIVIKGDEVHWEDVAGLDIAKNALKEAVVYPFLRPDLFLGLREPARGMLLFGPPGTGKTMLARAVATESRSTFFQISASSLTSKFLGESEKLVRALFVLAKALAPSIIFVDEIDSLLSTRSSSGEHEATRRIKTEFLIQWSDLAKAAAGREQAEGDATRVLVLAATNLPWAIDEAARRRFVRRQYIPLPEDPVRESQLRRLMGAQKHSLTALNFQSLVRLTDGFSGSDITALAKDAAMGPLRSLGEQLLHMSPDEIRPINFGDFEASLINIRPSVSKQGLKEFEDWAREFGERGG